MINVTAAITAYEKDGIAFPMIADATEIHCSSHHNYSPYVIIKCGDGPAYTVLARELISAIERCSQAL